MSEPAELEAMAARVNVDREGWGELSDIERALALAEAALVALTAINRDSLPYRVLSDSPAVWLGDAKSSTGALCRILRSVKDGTYLDGDRRIWWEKHLKEMKKREKVRKDGHGDAKAGPLG